MGRVLLIAGAMLASATGAAAQSFECRYARWPDEIAICDDAMLSRLDERMSRLFYRVRDSLDRGERADLDADQDNWLRSRRRCGRDPDCLEMAYRRRIRELRDY